MQEGLHAGRPVDAGRFLKLARDVLELHLSRADEKGRRHKHLRDHDRRCRERQRDTGPGQHPAEHAAPPERHEQRQPRDDGRHHHRHLDQHVEHPLQREAVAGEDIGQGHAERDDQQRAQRSRDEAQQHRICKRLAEQRGQAAAPGQRPQHQRGNGHDQQREHHRRQHADGQPCGAVCHLPQTQSISRQRRARSPTRRGWPGLAR